MHSRSRPPTYLRLSDVCRQLHKPYQTVFLAVVEGKIPAERDPGGTRWRVRESDLPLIAEVLGCSFTPARPAA